MSIQIALDEATNDIIKLDNGNIARVKEGRYTVQLVKNKLQTILGEWLLDASKGWLNFNDFRRNPDLFDIEIRAKEVILSCKGVQSVDSINLKISNRVLNLTFVASTIYGVIELTIPWSL